MRRQPTVIQPRAELRIPDLDVLERLRDRVPADAFNQLDDDLPLLLLPVRLETKYDLEASPQVLRIRIYPDQIHVHSDSPEPTQDEIVATKEFWTRWLKAPNKKKRRAAFQELTRSVGPRRAGHLARLVEPKDSTGDPVFPDVKAREEPDRSRPVLLPERWIAIGYRYSTILFNVEGAPIDPDLVVDVDPNDASWTVDGSGLQINPATAWMFDYDRAVEQGMAITVPLDGDDGQVGPGTSEITTLLVVGVRSGTDPNEEALELIDALEMHERSSGAAFVPQGTPTNNTSDVASGWTRAEQEDAEMAEREIEGVKGSKGDNADMLATALGLPARPILRRLAHGDDRERQHSRSMNSVLFETVWGTYLRQLLSTDSVDFPEATITALRIWFIQQVTGGAPIPALRIGPQPYGILPVRTFGTGGTDTRAENVERIVNFLKWEWVHSVNNVPTLDPNDTDIAGAGDAEENIPAVLSSHPHPARLIVRRFYDDDNDFWNFLSPTRLYDAAINVLGWNHF